MAADAAGAAPQPPADLIELGAVRGAYGVRGWVRIQPHDAEAAVLRAAQRWWLQRQGSTPCPIDVTAVRRQGAALVARWRGWESLEAADALRGATVAVPRSEFPPLPAGEYYWTDLIGLQVVNREAQPLGTVAALTSNGMQDLLQIEANGQRLLVPLVPAYVDEVDLAARVIRVDWQLDWS